MHNLPALSDLRLLCEVKRQGSLAAAAAALGASPSFASKRLALLETTSAPLPPRATMSLPPCPSSLSVTRRWRSAGDPRPSGRPGRRGDRRRHPHWRTARAAPLRPAPCRKPTRAFVPRRATSLAMVGRTRSGRAGAAPLSRDPRAGPGVRCLAPARASRNGDGEGTQHAFRQRWRDHPPLGSRWLRDHVAVVLGRGGRSLHWPAGAGARGLQPGGQCGRSTRRGFLVRPRYGCWCASLWIASQSRAPSL